MTSGSSTGVCLQRCSNVSCTGNTDTWANYGQAFFATDCASCHTHNHSNQFTTQALVRGDLSGIRARISTGNMPQGITVSAADKARILAYLDCGVN